MMKKRRLISFAVGILLIFLLTIPAFAVTSVSVWYSDEDNVRYNPYDGSYYIYNLSSSSSFSTSLQAAITRANSQWSSVLPISISETSFNYAINYIYGGTYSQLKDSFPDLKTSNTGLTYTYPQENDETIVYYNSSRKKVYPLKTGGKMCVVEKNGRTTAGYKNTAIHEMGHLFGWKGHSSNSSDVMYSYATEITSLTTRDKTHLKQIYTLFY